MKSLLDGDDPGEPVVDAHDAFARDPRWSAALRSTLFPDSLEDLALVEQGRTLIRIPLAPSALRAGPLRLRLLGTPADGGVYLSDIEVAASDRASEHFDRALAQLSARHEWDALEFTRVRERAQLWRALSGSAYTYSRRDAGTSAYCDVSAPDALTAISKEQLRNVDRLSRRANKDQGAVARITLTGPEVAASAYDRFVALESAGWKGAEGEGTGLAVDLRAQAFFRDVLRRFQVDGSARLDFLTIDGRDAAAQLAIRTGRTWFLLKIGYHPDFREVGPGAILLKAFLEEMRDDATVREVNFTTNPPWAARWHFRTERCFHVYVHGRSWRARLFAGANMVRDALRSLRDAGRR